MNITDRDIEKMSAYLQEWNGGAVSFNAFHDDHDRLILRLEHPSSSKSPIGLALFYCSYVAGPVKWKNGRLEARTWLQSDGLVGLELVDEAVGFVVRCASASMYGEPALTVPKS